MVRVKGEVKQLSRLCRPIDPFNAEEERSSM